MKNLCFLLAFLCFVFADAQTKLDDAYNNLYMALILQKQEQHKEALAYFDK